MTEEFCSNIEDHAVEGTIYDDIEEATVRDHSLNVFPPNQFNLNVKLTTVSLVLIKRERFEMVPLVSTKYIPGQRTQFQSSWHSTSAA